LLVGAGLLVKNLVMLRARDAGIQTERIVAFDVTLPAQRYKAAEQQVAFYRELNARLSAAPGVDSAGMTSHLPMFNFGWNGEFQIEGTLPWSASEAPLVEYRWIFGDYLKTLGIRLVQGRLLDDRDRSGSTNVLINQTMASKFWPNQDPIGKRIRMGDLKSTSPWIEVVGVVGRVKQYGLDSDGRIAFYLAHTQSPQRALYLTVKTAGDPSALAAGVKTAIASLDPDLPLYRVQTMDRRVQQSLARQRFAMTLLTLFAALALVLAAIGIYGVMAYLVSQGTREIGIRIALGATQGGILNLVLRQGLTVAVVGAGAGLAAGLLLARLMQSLLFGVRASDPATFAVVAIVLAATALVATYVPARRAARTDPMVALVQFRIEASTGL